MEQSSILSDSTSGQGGKLQQALARHPLLNYFLLAYAISWILSIPFILSEWGLIAGDQKIWFVLKGFGPFISAYILSWAIAGKGGMKRLREQMRKRKAAWPWFMLVIMVIPLLLIAGILVQPGTTAGFKGLSPVLLASYPLTYAAVFFGGGPLGEEPGWRGFALPRLQQKFGALVGTLILGVLWTCWHLPDFLTSAQGGGPGTGISAFMQNFPIFLALVMSFAVLLTWIYNKNNGNIFLALLAHASINTPQVALVPLFPAVTTTSLNLAALIGYGIPAVLLLFITKGKLGYVNIGQTPK
jgi:membrane protease YdiL (CAAX protease family)